jgi:GTP pyrophosphokinase
VETLQLCPAPIRESIALTRSAIEEATQLPPERLALGAEAAEVMGALTDDPVLAAAVLARPVVGLPGITPEKLARLVGSPAAETALALVRLGELGLPRDWSPTKGLDSRQAETLRKMLLAVVSDPRLVLARLAEQLVGLRHARSLPATDRERLAVETRAVFAPLANRLGVWQLKWELEDLAFRYLDADEYRRIAAALNERRADRERYIEDLCSNLQAELRKAGIDAEVYGRPKHMYSIYRKMQRKHLAFEQLFDVRAVRVVVSSIPECYAALGVVHGLWHYIPGEFDDYIATPKGNFYRSIHTAVIGPGGKSVEVQIRTREMHEHAELGVAAHWTYKEGGARNATYERKIEWVRKLLEPQDTSTDETDRNFLERMRTELFEDRVYALTPKGEVIDLPRGATPLDFAYQIHTSLGHRCKGAKVNGRIVPLTYTLNNGEVVEIIAGKLESPSRDWLAPEQGYLGSPHSRTKVRAWFRKQEEAAQPTTPAAAPVAPGRAAGASRDSLRSAPVAPRRAAGASRDSLRSAPVAGPVVDEPPPVVRRRARRALSGSPVEIEGVGDLPTTLARCCAPLRPQPIAGYVTLGRGVTIHRMDCPSLTRMRALKPERVLQVEWASDKVEGLVVQISVSAYDRRGLVRDVTDVLALERLSIEAMTTTTDRDAGTAHVLVTVSVTDLDQLARLLRRLAGVPNVTHARRVH